jgi:hypothetical protein
MTIHFCTAVVNAIVVKHGVVHDAVFGPMASDDDTTLTAVAICHVIVIKCHVIAKDNDRVVDAARPVNM